MSHTTRRVFLALLCATSISACSASPVIATASAPSGGPALYPNETYELRQQINKWADFYDVPRPLVQRLAIRESTHNPKARNGIYYGLLQINPATARGMGFQGENSDLLNADTNLKYAVKYLRGAWLLSDGSHDTAVKWYSQGYYFEAKRRGMLVKTGLRSG